MHSIRRLRDFEMSVERLKRSGIKNSVFHKLEKTIDILAAGKKLPTSYRDHRLRGELKDRRECHIHQDILLVYKIDKGNLLLVLIDIGTHSRLF